MIHKCLNVSFAKNNVSLAEDFDGGWAIRKKDFGQPLYFLLNLFLIVPDFLHSMGHPEPGRIRFFGFSISSTQQPIAS